MKRTLRVLLADDHALVRDGFKSILDEQDGIEVVAVASNGADAVTLCQRTKPDIVLIDVVMPKLNGIDATEQIRQQYPSTRVIIVSARSDVDYVYRALRAGADGYVSKTSAATELIKAIRTVIAGRRFLSEGITKSLLDDYVRTRSAKSPLQQLSTRERQILQMMAEGRSSASIAKDLSLSPKTVDTYRSRMMEKLGITELPALIKFAIRHGLTPPE